MFVVVVGGGGSLGLEEIMGVFDSEGRGSEHENCTDSVPKQVYISSPLFLFM